LEEAAKLGAQTEKIILSQYQINGCQGHDGCASFGSCRQKDDTAWILDKFCRADGVILATPVYYYNVTAQMKCFIDRTYYLYMRNQKSRARAVGVIVVADSEGIEDTLYTLRQFIDEAFEIGEDRLFIVSGYAGKVGEVRHDLSLIEEARKLGRQMAASLKDETGG
jgi:multimeric flavodoxin WrbA